MLALTVIAPLLPIAMFSVPQVMTSSSGSVSPSCVAESAPAEIDRRAISLLTQRQGIRACVYRDGGAADVHRVRDESIGRAAEFHSRVVDKINSGAGRVVVAGGAGNRQRARARRSNRDGLRPVESSKRTPS